MKTTTVSLRTFLFAILVMYGYFIKAQTPGIIVRPAGGAGVTALNPDGNTWASALSGGFTTNDITQSELPFRAVPATFIEPTGDLTNGPSGGYSDIVKDASGNGFYSYYDGTNIFFRIRIGSLVSGSKGYSVLIDSDSKFGNTGTNPDPNYVATTNGSNGNPGFEWEVVLESNSRVAIYSVDGTTTPVFVTSYALATNHQIAVAITTNSGDPDFLVDFYIPLSALTGYAHPVTASTPVRMVATTVMSAGSAIGGPKSDIYGIGTFVDAIAAWTSIVTNTPTFTPTNLTSGGSGIPGILTASPVLTTPINTGSAITIGGTWTRLDTDKGNSATITLYKNNVSVGTTTVSTGNAWSFNNILVAVNDVFHATAQATGETVSPESNSFKVLSCSPSTTSTTTGLVFSCTSERGMEGTRPLNASVKLYSVSAGGNPVAFANDATGTYKITYGTSTTWRYDGQNANGAQSACSGGAVDVVQGQYLITATESGKCESNYISDVNSCSFASTTAAPTITQTILYEGNTIISGTAAAAATLRYYRNGVLVSSVTLGAGVTTYSFSGLTLYKNDLVEIRAQTAGLCSSPFVTRTIGAFTNKPFINHINNVLIAGATTITGTSSEPTGTSVSVYENAILMGSTTVQSNGTWSYTITVTSGRTYYATQTKTGATVSDPTPTYSVLSATTLVPAITGAYTVSASSVAGTISTFTGKVFLYIDGFKADSVTVTAGTAWSIPVNTTNNNTLYTGASLTAAAQATSSAENATRSAAVVVTCALPTTPVISPVSSTIYSGKTITYSVTSAQSGMLFSLGTAAGDNLGVSAFGSGSNLNITSYTINTAGSYAMRLKSTSFSGNGCETFATASLTVLSVPSRIYVDQSIGASGNGESWGTAFKELSEALQFATTNAGVSELWLKAGTHKPLNDASGNSSPADNRTKTFSVPSGLTVYGGFAGTETLLSQRNITTNLTILSGDLGVPITTSDNSYHVVTVTSPASATALNGITITAGNANGTVNNAKGGGIYTSNGAGNFSMDKVTVISNLATTGAGMYNNGSGASNSANPTISNSIFKSNVSTGSGGAIYSDGSSSGNSSPNFVKTFFDSNSAADGGANYRTGSGTSVYTNCIFVNNSATATGNAGGGAMHINGGTANFTNCTLNGNSTASSVNPSANSIAVISGSTANLLNTIVWGSAALHIYNAGTINYTTSDVKGAGLTAPNASANPLFSNSSDADGADNIWGTADDGLFVLCASPASKTGTNAGAPATDVLGTTRPNPPSMGAYEAETSTVNEWKGTTSSNWNDATNWCSGVVPTGIPNISIYNTAPNAPVMGAGTFVVGNVFIEAGSTLTVTGILKIDGSLTTNGGLNATAGTIELNGRAAQIIPANTFVSNTVKHLVTDNTEGVTVADSLNITGSLKPKSGAFATGGLVTLKSTSIANTAIIAQVEGSIVGDIIIERFIPVGKRAYRQLSSGVNSTDNIRANWQENGSNVPGLGLHITGSKTGANGFDATWSGEYNMYTYVAGAPNYSAVTATNGNNKLKALQGYRVFFNGDRFANLTILQNSGAGTPNFSLNNTITLRAKGTVVTGPVTFNSTGATANGVTDNSITLAAGLNQYALIANPYWSAVNFDQITKNNVELSYYIWDPSIGNRGASISYTVGVGTSNGVSWMDNNIQPGQAIFVKTIGANPSLVFNEANKTSTFTSVFRTPSQTPSKIRIYLYENNSLANNGTMQDGTTVAFRDDFSAEINGHDATKFTNTDENIAIVRGTTVLGLEARPTVTAADTIPLRLWKLYANNQYTLKLTSEDFDTGIEAFIHDKFTNIQHPINMTGSITLPFSFTLTDSSSFYNRFAIYLRPTQTLPVTFTQVKATRKNEKVLVEWKVASESNIREYQVEKSKDGRTFEVAGTTMAKMNNDNAADYNWLDANPYAGANFYRIVSVEKSGETKYSVVVKVNMTDSKGDMSIYPNPVLAGHVNISVKELPAETYQLKVYNATGQLVETKSVIHAGGVFNQKIQIDNSLPNGMYSVVLSNQSVNISQSFTK